jgi:HD-GYP domain-containing protein (c-di-GMP phosphodiesterase class II)
VIPQRGKLCNSVLVSIEELRLGMFITELDRPWTQSPFMLQGFLLKEPLDLQTLQSLVKEIVIDPTRSVPGALLHLPWESIHEIASTDQPLGPVSLIRPINSSPQVPSLPTSSFFERALKWVQVPASHRPTPYYLEHDKANQEQHPSRSGKSSKTSPPSTIQFSHFIQALYPRDVIFAPLNWLEKWKIWQEQRAKEAHLPRGKNVRQRSTSQRRPKYLPKELKLVNYEDHTPMQDELTHARKVIEKADVLLKKLTREISSDKSIALDEVRPTVRLLAESVISNPSALIWLVRMGGENTTAYAQGLKVAVYMMTLGRHLGFRPRQLTELGFIGLLLDIGKLELPDTLLMKPDKLSEEEQHLMRTHVSAGIDILNTKEPLPANVLLGIGEHHERLDGSGYPHGLTETDISIFGKISAIADSFSAMTSPRPYDITRSSFDAMKELFKMSGDQLHAPLVEEFVQAIGIFPVGSMIELSSGEVAIVLEHNKIRRLEPKVLLLTAADKSLLEEPIVTNLMQQKTAKDVKKLTIFRGLPDGAYGLACKDFYRS